MSTAAGRTLRRDALANQERVLAAAVVAVLREGRQVSMATIAADAGVGVATLYRRYPNREALLSALTERSFEMVLAAAEAASRAGNALVALEDFFDRTINHRNQLVLPLHGGPVTLSPQATATRARVHEVLEQVLERGRRERSIRTDVGADDIVAFGAMLAQSLPGITDWTQTAHRQKTIFLNGVAAQASMRHAESSPY